MRRQEDAGFKPLDDRLLQGRSVSYEKHLTRKGVKPEDYEVIYELAVQIHAKEEFKRPFGIDHLLEAAESLYNGYKANEPFKLVKKVPRKNCSTCKGTSLRFLDNGQIDYEEKEGKKVAKRCDNCYESKNKEITS